MARPAFNTTNGNQDKEWITVDNFPGTGLANAYMFWRISLARGMTLPHPPMTG